MWITPADKTLGLMEGLGNISPISNLDFIRAKASIIHGTRFLLSDSNCKLPTIIRTSFFWKLEVANKVALYYQTGWCDPFPAATNQPPCNRAESATQTTEASHTDFVSLKSSKEVEFEVQCKNQQEQTEMLQQQLLEAQNQLKEQLVKHR